MPATHSPAKILSAALIFKMAASLSNKANLLLARLIQAESVAFTLADIQRIIASNHMSGFSINSLYRVLFELEEAEILTHSRPAPSRPAEYRFTTDCETFSSDLSSSDLSDLNKNNDGNREALPQPVSVSSDESQKITELAKAYHLQPEHLFSMIEERKAKGKLFTMTILETILKIAKERAQTNFAGYFYVLFVMRDVYENIPPLTSQVAQESGYKSTQPTPQQANVTQARPSYPKQQIASPEPNKCVVTSTEEWKATIERNLNYHSFKTWILPCSAKKTGETITITTPDPIFINHFQEQYLPLLSETFGVNVDALRFEVMQ